MMNFTKQQIDLININLTWTAINAGFDDPYDAIEAYADSEYDESLMEDFRAMKKKYEETYNEYLNIDANYSMTWGTNAYGIYSSLQDFT